MNTWVLGSRPVMKFKVVFKRIALGVDVFKDNLDQFGVDSKR